MFLQEVSNMKVFSQLSLKHVEDRLIITAEFPKAFLRQNRLQQPFLYVSLYVRGGAIIKIIDEGTAELYSPSKKEFAPETYKQIIQFAMEHAPQFKNKAKK
ncbi:hypothetical protein NC661_10255 [Aquibacillus koreensis]|uniref:Uncharacterized protein n=1 Tax=Aquibacillus koreensis TaxID=279446 RepID=A0A9X3WL79_9BACI|nr:hypothetical protein [Aquibacillus koreensis]MCT2534205.1 hypothetical protein [Aquibacillus koreensis]MDC3420750.1 hypothetical protein [Aquibacillus koreensis]